MKISSEYSRAKIKIGPAGWSYQDWRGVVYPTPRPRGFHEASYLAHYFPVIEINTSFYRPVRPELSRLWVKKDRGDPSISVHRQAVSCLHPRADSQPRRCSGFSRPASRRCSRPGGWGRC